MFNKGDKHKNDVGRNERFEWNQNKLTNLKNKIFEKEY
jgi:hypothetical protein